MAPQPGSPPKYAHQLAELLLRSFFQEASTEQREQARAELVARIYAYAAGLPGARRKILRAVRDYGPAREPRAPPQAVRLLLDELGLAGLTVWLRRRPAPPGSTDDELRAQIAARMAGLTEPQRVRLLEAGLRSGAGLATTDDETLISTTLSQPKEAHVALTFKFDLNSLPQSLRTTDAQTKYENAVTAELNNLGNSATPDPVALGAIVGMLLLDEYFHPDAPGFSGQVKTAWLEFLGKTRDFGGNEVRYRDVFKQLYDYLDSTRSSTPEAFYQEFAFAGRQVIQSVDRIPPGHPSFTRQLELGLNAYVAGKAPFDSLDLPPLTGDDGAAVEIVADNIRAVAVVYAAYQLEQMMLFRVVDRVTELFMNGLLPIGFDAGGRALDAYYWNSEDQMSEAARFMQYSRVLGARGGDVSREVKPNAEFEGLWIRALSSVSERFRQQRLSDIFGGIDGRALIYNDEHVRKAMRDLAANLSLYGYAYTHFAARRLNQHITTAFGILNQPTIQRVYGVTTPWQVIERVASTEFGQVPNIVRYRTMADAGKKILDLVARYASAWTDSSGRPLFYDLGAIYRGVTTGSTPALLTNLASTPLFDPNDQQLLLGQTESWLAVNGIKDAQVDQYAEPVESSNAPSLPAYGGGSDGNLDQLRQMIAAGQVPSLDQLKQMLPVAGVGV